MATKQSLIITTTASAADSSSFPKITGMAITATEPTGTLTRYLVKTDSTWQKYNTSTSAWEDADTQDITPASVIAEGNTMAEINALTSTAFTSFTGKIINVAVGLQTTNDDQPTITSIKIKGETGAEQLTETVNHETITLADSAVEILDITVDTTTEGNGKAEVQASIQSSDDSWSDYKTYTSYITNPATTAKAIKFRSILTVKSIGTDKATVNSIAVKHRTDNISVVSEGDTVCITKTYDFVNPITKAHLMVKHPVVSDTTVTAEIALRESPTYVTGEVLGTGTGAKQTVTLANTTNLASHGFVLYFDGVSQSSSKYSYSVTDGQVSFTADEGVAVTADYIYGWSDEKFVSMTHDTEYPDKEDNSLVDDQFDYVAGDNDPKGSVGTVRVTLTQESGTVKNEVIGTSTGAQISHKLAHKAKADTIVVSPTTATWTYKEKANVLMVTADNGAEITASYSWSAATNYIESIACIFNE